MKAKKVTLKKTSEGKLKAINLELGAKDLLLFQLKRLDSLLSTLKIENKVSPEDRQFLKEAIELFSSYLVDLVFNIDKKGESYTVSVTLNTQDESIRNRINKALEHEYTQECIKEYLLPKALKEALVSKNRNKFKVSGHLTDQKLKYNYPGDNQPSLFDSLQEKTKSGLLEAGVSRETTVEGIKLSPSETKVIDSLCKLLHYNSQNLDAEKDSYYSGNMGYGMIAYGGEDVKAPKLAFTLYELTKEYKGGDYVAGKDLENVKSILNDLHSKKFLLNYKETTKKKDGTKKVREIEEVQALIKILKLSETEYNKDNIELSKTEETLILLNPIFKRQIDSKFILYPDDINKRTIIAYGSHNISEITLRLRDYLMRELSSKHYTPEIGQDKLYYLLAEKWMKESRKKKVKEYTDKAIDTVIKLGLVNSYKIDTDYTGEPKIVFSLNKDWE